MGPDQLKSLFNKRDRLQKSAKVRKFLHFCKTKNASKHIFNGPADSQNF